VVEAQRVVEAQKAEQFTVDEKAAGSTPVYHPNANDESDTTRTTKNEEREKKIRIRGKSAEKGSSGESIYEKTKEAKFSTTEGGESEINERERSRGVYNGGRA
jgi:hypothetical protein